jgi:hypothetical protein
MANTSIGGYRFVRTSNGGHGPSVMEFPVADSNSTAIFTGDVVKMTSGGFVDVAAAGDTQLLGVCHGVVQYWDGEFLRQGRYLPASTTSGSVRDRQSRILVTLAEGAVFEVDADDGVTATTEAAFQAFVGENCDITAGAGSTATGQSGHSLDIGDHKSGAAQVRIVGLSSRLDNDFTSTRAKLLVKFNEDYLASTSGV